MPPTPAAQTRPQFEDEDPAVRTKLADEDVAAVLKLYEALSEEDKAKADEARGKPPGVNTEALVDAAKDGETATVRGRWRCTRRGARRPRPRRTS